MVDAEVICRDLRSALDAHAEWLLIRSAGRAFPVRADEIEVSGRPNAALFGFPDDAGYHSWRLNGFEIENGEVAVDVAGRFGKAREILRLVPRTPAAELAAEVELARLKKASEVAGLIESGPERAKIVRVELSKDNSRYARIFYRNSAGGMSAAITDVTGNGSHESVLSTAIVWMVRLGTRKKEPVVSVTIVAEKKQARNLQKLCALLGRYRDAVQIAEIERKKDAVMLKTLRRWDVRDLWREKPKKLVLPENPYPGKTAQKIIAMDPDRIDVLRSKQGETLRFLGLPFARVRRIGRDERAWFGIGRNRHVLNARSWKDLADLVRELELNRAWNSANKRHEQYRLAPEAWLESILRRNINLLDPNLILSPLYNQFRAASDKIDLLALRKDGRLVIIELKTSPDRDMIFQAADYWRKIELQRRSGQLRDARAFGEREIMDKPALIYAVAPALNFHRDFGFFAEALSPQAELWRFELHENWRRKTKVIARRNYADRQSD